MEGDDGGGGYHDSERGRKIVRIGEQLDVEAYGSLYNGRTKIGRLMFIADRSGERIYMCRFKPFFICNLSLQTNAGLEIEPAPIFTSVKTFAPATVANLGPGYDCFGCAVDGVGDHVTLRVDSGTQAGQISISEIDGVGDSGKRLSKDPLWNCAGIAAIAMMKKLGIRSVGLSLSLHKGLPLGSGLGSSAASAAAAAVAVNEIFGRKLGVQELVEAGLESEAKVSGYQADNIAPAIMGGFVLIRSYEPLQLRSLKFPDDKNLFFVLVNPEFEAPTKKMRVVLPKEVAMSRIVWNCSQALALGAAVVQGDVSELGSAMSADHIVEPRRAPLIPGFESVKKAALEADAYGCTISGAGPTAVAVVDNEEAGLAIEAKMVEAFTGDDPSRIKASTVLAPMARPASSLSTTATAVGQP